MQPPHNEPVPDAFGFNDGFDRDPKLPNAKTLVELEMTRLSSDIRRIPSWWIKCRDKDILNKWRTETIPQAKFMKEPHIDYVLKELDGYANLRDEITGAEVSCYDRIWQSDRLVPQALKERLITSAQRLEDVPEEEKDWHPRSNKQVLDLVHPSLYPLVYGRTLSYPEDSNDWDPATLAVHLKPPPPAYSGRAKDYFVSHRFQWLPTDFKVSEDGKSVKSVSYINNLHPIEHAKLHAAIEDLIAVYIPLFERVLTDSIPDNHAIPTRTQDDYSYDDDEYPNSPVYESYSDNDKYDEAYSEWRENRPISTPEIITGSYEPGTLEKREISYDLGGRTIQVIVKLANIHLTPENPKYTGGSWHVEGMKNEAIAVSGIYYYDEENITESRLAFRTAVNAPRSYEQSDEIGCKLTWGMAKNYPCVNALGSVITCQDRCIAFPNTYQHCVSPFELSDKSKPGHRKIVALFLVDPAIHRPSTTIVPPQQKEWHASGISANPVLKAAFNKLSPEIIDHIDSMVEGTMSRAEAEAYRLQLMDERKAFVAKNNKSFFMVPFNIAGGSKRTPPLVDIRRERPWPGRGDGREDMLDTLEKEAISQARLYKSASRATKRSNNHVSLGDEASSAKASSSTNTWESDGHARAPSKERSIIGATERGRGPERNKYWEQTPPFSQGYNDRNTATFATGSIPPAPTHSGGEGSDSD